MPERNLVNGRAQNCFALSYNSCSVLKVTQCETCNFFKTKKQLADEKARCAARLRKMNYDNKYMITI